MSGAFQSTAFQDSAFQTTRGSGAAGRWRWLLLSQWRAIQRREEQRKRTQQSERVESPLPVATTALRFRTIEMPAHVVALSKRRAEERQASDDLEAFRKFMETLAESVEL